MASTDFVVVIPGIMGSTLKKNDKPVWAPSGGAVLRGLATFFRSIKRLQLPDGAGDNAAGDGVEPVALMPDLHLLPGIWTPVKGYTPLVKRLAGLGYRRVSKDDAAPPGNLLEFPYDWRLSNRYNGKRLAADVERELNRWRAQSRQFADAQVVLVCHSMGGLVARWFIEKEKGAEVTRKLITFGTPYRGAMRALDQLSNGVHPGIGPLSLNLDAFAHSLPSLHQLLPSYACVESPGGLVPASHTTPPGIDTGMLADATRFFSELEAAEAARPGSADIRHAIVGTNQTTATTARIADHKVKIVDTYQTKDLRGDGTVPLVAGPKGVPLDSNTLRRIADKHGDLHRNSSALDELEGILTSMPIVAKAALETELRVDLPELLLAGQPLHVTVERSGRDAVKITMTDEAGNAEVRTPRPRGGTVAATFTDLAPGAYTVDASGLSPASPVAPVSSDLLVWSESELARQGFDE
jgi:pimeloyl-ACP methyl ester carboxylesterase